MHFQDVIVMLRVIIYVIFITSCVLHAGCQNVIGYGPPRLLFETSDSKQVNANDSFKLECESDRPIYWIYPILDINPEMYEEVDYETVINISDSQTSTGQYHSVLTLTTTNFLDTGNYSCLVNGTSSYDANNAASIYIYVKDLTNLLVRNDTSSFMILWVIQYQPAVIPCRPSSPDVVVTLMKEGDEGDCTFISDPVSRRNCGRNTHVCYMSALTVGYVKVTDAGNYTCLVTDHNGITNNDTQEIKIYEPGMEFINLTHDGLEFNVPSNRPNVTWMIHVDAAPPPNFKWLNQEGDEIDVQNNMNKYKMEISKRYEQVMLVIYDVQVKDAGTYVFIAYYGSVTGSLNLTLIVREKPTVNIEGGGEIYYQLGKNYTVECKVLGYPAPNLKWSFLNCDLMSECSETNFQTYKEVSDLEFDKRAYQYVSTFVWTVTLPGHLKCYAENTEGNGTDIMSIFVTDIPEEQGLNIWGKPDKVIEGDTITLFCGAIKYNYSDDISWYERRVDYQTEYLIEYKPGEQYVLRNDTPYSYRAKLMLLNVKLGSDGNYSCEARRREDGVPETREQIINVIAQKEPKIVSTNLNGTEMLINSGTKIDMYCKAEGLPVPKVKWYKDNTLLQVYNDSRMVIKGDQLIIPFAKFEDEGEYRCDVTNRLKTVSRSISLKFEDKPGDNMVLIISIIVSIFVFIVVSVVLGIKLYKEMKFRKELYVAELSNFVHGAMENINPALPVDDQADLLPYDKKWEFPRDKLKLGKQLGSGAFGVVMKAEAWKIIDGELKSTVAVKMVKGNADHTYIKALASELKIMIHLGKHLNVVNLLGACTKNLTKMELLVIVEYCCFGNLHNYLLRHREEFIDQIDPKTGQIDPEILSRTESLRSNSKLKHASLSFSNSSGARSDSGGMPVDYQVACPTDSGNCTSDSLGMDTEMNLISLTPTDDHDEFMLSNKSRPTQPECRSNYRGDYKGARPICTYDLLCWSFQVARGMEYLASRKVLHGDLAARNILLADDNIVKICDFGLSKSMYNDKYHKKGCGPLPVKWMAVESIRDRVFSTQSDVWSYGIVLWEFFSLARTPYPGMEADEKFYNKLAGGYRMEKPEYSTADIYSVMLKCWEARPVNRPTFTDLTERLGSMLEESVRRHYIDLNDPYMKMNAQWLQGLENDYLGMMNAPTYDDIVSPYVDDEHESVNGPHQAESTSDRGESSGYLCMKSPTPEVVTFQSRTEGNQHLQNLTTSAKSVVT